MVHSPAPYLTDDAVHDPRLYDVLNDFDYDLPFWEKHCRAANGPVLELCCGTGRLTVPLAKKGIPITGVDVSERMLAGFRARAEREGCNLAPCHADVRHLRLDRKFALVFIPFNSFQCLYSLEEIECTLAGVRAHLQPGGRFILDVFNPSIELMVERNRAPLVQEFTVPGVGTVAWSERCAYDTAGQVNRVDWVFRFPDGHEEHQHLDMRCFYPQELRALLKYNGFSTEAIYGNYDEAPFHKASTKQIFVCTPTV